VALTPIGHLFAQIRVLSSCGVVPPTGHCSCDIINESLISQRADEPDSLSSLPSLESQSSSSIDSIYHSPTFLSSVPVPSLVVMSEGFSNFTIIFQGGLPSSSTLPPLFSGDSGSFEEVISGEVFEGGSSGISLLGNEGWYSGHDGSHAVDFVAGRD